MSSSDAMLEALYVYFQYVNERADQVKMATRANTTYAVQLLSLSQ